MSDTGQERSGDKAFHRISDGLRSALPAVARLLLVGPSLGVVVTVKQRAEYDWLVVIKRGSSAEGPQVLFGFGVGPIEALGHADNQLRLEKWREDKPWRPPVE